MSISDDRARARSLGRKQSENITIAIIGAGAVVAAALLGVATAVFSGNTDDTRNAATRINIPGWAGIPIAAVALLWIASWSWLRYKDHKLFAQQLEEDWQDTKRLEAETTLPSLLRLNRKMLDGYHSIAIGQANKSFRSSQVAMWIGYILVVACGVAALRVPSAESKITIAALGAVGAALSGFLQRTYLRVYDRSLEQLNRYFDQPLVNSHYLTAERILLREGNEPELIKRLVLQVLHSAQLQASQVPSTSESVKVPRRRRQASNGASSASPQPEPDPLV